jgi:hypothetical protein
MSGPKVVRIVTREEIIAICKDLLAQLDVEVRRWEKVGYRNELLEDGEIAATRKRQAEIQSLLAADRFVDLQKQVPDEIAYLQSDMTKRLGEAASKAAHARAYGRRLSMLAQQSLDRHVRGDLALPDGLRRDLEAVVAENGHDSKSAEKALSDALALTLANASSSVLTPEQKSLADRLRGDTKSTNLDQWLKSTLDETEAVSVKVDGVIEQLMLAGATALAARFTDRHRAIQEGKSKPRRQMLADTLMLDVGKALTDIRIKAEQLRTLEVRAAPLSSLNSSESKELANKVAVALAEEDTASAGNLLTQVETLLNRERKALASKAQRSAILTALKDLGYEVREGMETAAPKDGKVVLRRAANPEMGVEIIGIQGAERLQFRPVRFGQADSADDRSKDRDIETIWCSDFDRLKNNINASGILTIEHARPVGAVPVLVVGRQPKPDEWRPDVRTPNKLRFSE